MKEPPVRPETLPGDGPLFGQQSAFGLGPRRRLGPRLVKSLPQSFVHRGSTGERPGLLRGPCHGVASWFTGG